MLSSMKKGEEDKLFVVIPVSSSQQTEGTGVARAESWTRGAFDGDRGSRGSFVSICLASRETSEILGFQEGKKKGQSRAGRW